MASIPNKRVDHKVQRQVDPFIVYGIDAAGQALEDAGLTEMSEEERFRAGVSIGSGIGGLPGIEKESIVLHERGPRRVSPHFVHGRLINLISGQVSIKYGLMGPNHAVVTACSTGAHSIGDAGRMIAMDDADVMLAGGAEDATLSDSALPASPRRGRCRPISTTSPNAPAGPMTRIATASSWARARAWSCSRNMSGPRRAAPTSMPSWSATACRATPITSPRRIRKARAAIGRWRWRLKRSGLDLGDIDYINAHGTSTPLGDELELGAVRRLFGNHIGELSMSSTKSAIGHLLGGAGAVESIFCILALRDQIVPPTLNLDNPSEGTAGVDLVPHVAKERKVKAVLNNSFGFGGTNASLIMKAV